MSRNVVITGRALNVPLGDDLPSVIQGWRSGKAAFCRDESMAKSLEVQHYVGLCPYMNLGLLPDRKVQKAITRKDLIGLVTALAAAKDAGLAKGKVQPERFGMFVGAGSTQLGDLLPYMDLIERCMLQGVFDTKRFGTDLMGQVTPMVMLQTLMNNTLCYASIALDIRGVNANYMDFQVAGLRALHEAMHAIKGNRADAVLVGGVAGRPEPYLADDGLRAGHIVRGLEKDLDAAHLIRPFDAKRTGTILSEGAAFLVLEEEDHALARGATILGRLSPMSFYSDAAFAFIDANASLALEKSISSVLSQVGYAKEGLSFVMAHANGSVEGDRVEAKTYGKVFGRRALDIPFHASKSSLGETAEAAPVINIILALDALNTGRIPATKNYDYGDEHTADLFVTKEEAEVYGHFALITARSFSGICTSVGVTNVV